MTQRQCFIHVVMCCFYKIINMSHKNLLILEQNEKGWKMTKGRKRYRKLKKKIWSKLRRKSEDDIGYKGYEF